MVCNSKAIYVLKYCLQAGNVARVILFEFTLVNAGLKGELETEVLQCDGQRETLTSSTVFFKTLGEEDLIRDCAEDAD